MILDYPPERMEKFSCLIAEMLSLSLGIKVIPPDKFLVKIYLNYISKIDNDNPIKDLLLLDKSFAERLINYKPEPHSFLAAYEDIKADAKKRSESDMDEEDVSS